jgi:hypothetical protein
MLIFGTCQPNTAEQFCYKKAQQLNNNRKYFIAKFSEHSCTLSQEAPSPNMQVPSTLDAMPSHPSTENSFTSGYQQDGARPHLSKYVLFLAQHFLEGVLAVVVKFCGDLGMLILRRLVFLWALQRISFIWTTSGNRSHSKA